jgi:plastocyanin
MDARSGLAALALIATACGGGTGSGSGNPTSPSPTPGGSQTTVTIAAGGVNPTQLRIEVGQQVQFVNSATQNIQIASDPHPTHGSCPPLDQLGMLTPGQSRAVTFTQRGTCTYHDHGRPEDSRFRGSILIGVTEPGPAPDYRTAQ